MSSPLNEKRLTDEMRLILRNKEEMQLTDKQLGENFAATQEATRKLSDANSILQKNEENAPVIEPTLNPHENKILSGQNVPEHNSALKNILAPEPTPAPAPIPIVQKIEILDPSKPKGENLAVVDVVAGYETPTPLSKTPKPF